MLESMHECECVEVLLEPSDHFSLEFIFIIINLFSNSMPPDVLFLFLFLGEAQNLHTIIIKRIRFCEINYIESNFLTFLEVGNSIEEPLSMSIGINIILQNQVIFILSNLHCCKQITRFKATFKKKRFIFWTLQFIKLFRSVFTFDSHFVCFHTFEITFFSFDIMFFDKLLDIDEIRSICQA